MNEGEKAGHSAILYLLIVGAGVYFTMFMVIFSFIKQIFWG